MLRRDLRGLHLLLGQLRCPVLWLTSCAKPGISKSIQPPPPQWTSYYIFWSVPSLQQVILKPNTAHFWSFGISFPPFEALLPALFHWCFFLWVFGSFVFHLFLCTSIHQHHRTLESTECKHLDMTPFTNKNRLHLSSFAHQKPLLLTMMRCP